MKFIRNLLSHGLLLTFIIALCAAYYYRAVVFSEEVNTRVDSAVNIVLVTLNLEPMQSTLIAEVPIVPVCESLKEVVVEDAVVEEVVVEDAVVEEVVVEDAVVEEVVVEDAVVEEDVVEDAAVEDAAVEDAAVEDAAVEDVVVEDVVVEDAVVEDAVVEDVVVEDVVVEDAVVEDAAVEDVIVNEEPTDAKIIMENIPVDRHFELLNQARFSHQIGNDFNAIELYRELIEAYPEDPNVYGELGNVYYSKGKWKQASHSYYEAAIRLHKIEKTDQINYLVRVIEGLDPETAQKLNDQLGHK